MVKIIPNLMKALSPQCKKPKNLKYKKNNNQTNI